MWYAWQFVPVPFRLKRARITTGSTNSGETAATTWCWRRRSAGRPLPYGSTAPERPVCIQRLCGSTECPEVASTTLKVFHNSHFFSFNFIINIFINKRQENWNLTTIGQTNFTHMEKKWRENTGRSSYVRMAKIRVCPLKKPKYQTTSTNSQHTKNQRQSLASYIFKLIVPELILKYFKVNHLPVALMPG